VKLAGDEGKVDNIGDCVCLCFIESLLTAGMSMQGYTGFNLT